MPTGTSALPSGGLWRELIDQLDEGVLVFDSQEIVVYANDEAATLLDYEAQDVLGLEKEDILALCQLTRMEGTQFAAALRAGRTQQSARRRFAIATVTKKLLVRPVWFWQEDGPVTVLLLRENDQWRSQLLSETVLRVLRGPLDLASDSAHTLIHSLTGGWRHHFELQDLARITRDSIQEALGIWETLARLETTHPTQASGAANGDPVHLAQALKAARQEMTARNLQGLTAIQFAVPGDLPPVDVAPHQLHAALCALLEGIASRLGPGDGQVTITARDRAYYVQVDVMANSPEIALQPYYFDTLPYAILEQVIIEHGGRLWFDTDEHDQPVCSFSLPLHDAEQQN